MQTEQFGYELPENVNAYQEIETGVVIQARGMETDDHEVDWIEVVEVVDLDDEGNEEHVTRLYEGHGLIPAQVYNRTISAYQELDEREDI